MRSTTTAPIGVDGSIVEVSMHPILAYIDPGSGSMIVQVLIASIIAIPVIFRARVAQLVHLIRRDEVANKPADGVDDSTAQG